jgi:hypothetical protein
MTTPGSDSCKFKGCGIIPYTYIKGKLHFLVYHYLEGKKKDIYTDFGGKRELKKDKSSYHTAAREFMEETCGILINGDSLEEKIKKGTDELVKKMIDSSVHCFYTDESYCTYVIHMDYFNPSLIPQKEHDKDKNRKCEWITYYDLLNSKRLHNRLKNTGICTKLLISDIGRDP